MASVDTSPAGVTRMALKGLREYDPDERNRRISAITSEEYRRNLEAEVNKIVEVELWLWAWQEQGTLSEILDYFREQRGLRKAADQAA